MTDGTRAPRDLRDLLDEAARQALPAPVLDPAPVVRQVRRGRRLRAAAAGTATLGLVAALVTSALALAPQHRTSPAPPAFTASPPAPTASSADRSPQAQGDCGSVIDPSTLTGTSGDVVVGALAEMGKPGATAVSVIVSGASASGSAPPVTPGSGVAVLLAGDHVVARAALSARAVSDDGGSAPVGAPLVADFDVRADLAPTSCATGSVLPDGDYRLAAVQDVRTATATATVLAGGEVVTVRGGKPATFCDGGPVVPNATEPAGPLPWESGGLRMDRTVGLADAARVTGFAAAPQLVLVGEDGRVAGVTASPEELTPHRGDGPGTYIRSAFFHACSGAAAVEPGSYHVLDVDDEDPWGTPGTTRTVADIATVTVPGP